MWVIVGLGNPGAAYAQTRHNVGFMVVETVARRWGIALRSEGHALRVGRGCIADRPVVLAEPRAFMNHSGATLALLALEAEDALVVVYDDLDLPAGQLRVRRRGGAAGHRGVTSIVAHFGFEFARVRVGIGRPADGHDPTEYVLAQLSLPELGAIQNAVERAGDAVECVVREGTDAAMSRFNSRQIADTV
jgi:PTH1 family peptidyl-tRNA hydrolase